MNDETKKKDGKPGRIGGMNSEYKSGSFHVPRRCINEIEKVLQENKDLAVIKDKKVGQETQDKRKTVIHGFFSDLFSLGFRIESIYNLKEKHLKAVFHLLEEQGQSPSTIQNKISIMRTFCNWIGKNGMVRDSSLYVKDKSSVRRSTVVKEDKSWEGKGVDVVAKLSEIREVDSTVGVELELCWAFGLRVKEAVMLRPAVAHEGEFIWVREGTKGDRPRVVPIENDIQRDVLERAKALADKKSGFLGKRGSTMAQKRRHFRYIMEKCGVTLKEEDITAHGLRHQYMHESYVRLLGVEPPVRGGDASELDQQELHEGKQKLMERAGHSRVSIGTAYYGSNRTTKRKAAITPENDLDNVPDEVKLNQSDEGHD